MTSNVEHFFIYLWPDKSLENVYSGPLPILKWDYLGFFFAIEL